MNRSHLSSALTLGLATAFASLASVFSIASAGPITTVPWNGRTGAVSFTYDDARTSQIPYLVPQLDSLGIKATFFISIQNIGDFNARRPAWIQTARRGHELTNHTYAHANVNGSDGVAVTAMIKDMADTLRKIDTAAIQSVTFAYPNCNLTANATAKNGVNAENFMARSCANPTLNWGTQPTDWMAIPGEILGPTSASTAVSRINAAKTNNRWYITIVHDVTPDNPDQYSMTPANNLTMLSAAVSAGVWIDTYATIGAYYRAHFTMDTVSVKYLVGTNPAWSLDWVSPHPKMPKSVPLRVKLDSTVFTGPIVVMQDTVVARQPDGSYVIDFMKLRLSVASATALSPAVLLRRAALHARVTGKRLDLSGLPAGEYAVALHDASGRMVQQRNIRSTGTAAQGFYFAAAPSNGLYQLTVRQISGGPARRVPIFILR